MKFEMLNSKCFYSKHHKNPLVFDAFIQKCQLYLVSTFYNNFPMKFEKQFSIEVNDDQKATFVEEKAKNEYEPSRIVIYQLPKLESQNYYDVRISFTLNEKSESVYWKIFPDLFCKSNLMAATLFKDDHQLITLYRNYYKSQGVENFVFYYNGDIKDVESKLPSHSDITYGSWNFPYWDKDNGNHIHLAQTAFLTMIRDRYSNVCEFMILNDLDEFISHDTKSLISYLQDQTFQCLIVPNCFSTLKQKSNDEEGKQIEIIHDQNHLGYGWGLRNKCIYSEQYKDLVGIHLPKNMKNATECKELVMYHIMNSDRAHWVKNPHPKSKILKFY